MTTTLPTYILASDGHDDHIWREDGDYPVPVLARRHVTDADLWAAIVALVTDTARCEFCGDDYALDESPCVHLMLCATCSADCRQCRTEPIEDDDARRELRLDEQGRWGRG